MKIFDKISILLICFFICVNSYADNMNAHRTEKLFESYQSKHYKDFHQVLSKMNFREEEIPILYCISFLESNFDNRSFNWNSNGSFDIGLFQINSIWKKKCKGNLFELENSIPCVRKILTLQGFKAWFAYREHKEVCDAFGTVKF